MLGDSITHRASPRQHLGRIEPGYQLDTSHKGGDHLDCKMDDSKVTQRDEPLYKDEENGDGSRRPSWRALVLICRFIYN